MWERRQREINAAEVQLEALRQESRFSSPEQRLQGCSGYLLAAFFTDLGDRMGDIVILTMSEFGRAVAETVQALRVATAIEGRK